MSQSKKVEFSVTTATNVADDVSRLIKDYQATTGRHHVPGYRAWNTLHMKLVDDGHRGVYEGLLPGGDVTEYTFRTEFSGDAPRAVTLLQTIGVTDQTMVIEDEGTLTISVHTFKIDEPDLEKVRDRLKALVWGQDPRFVDLHRCEQTLAKGISYANHP